MNKSTFLQKAISKHGNRYDYSHVPESVLHRDVITIVCPDHGEFTQRVNSHLLRSGCPTCGKIASGSKRQKTRLYYLEKANATHNNKYKYSNWPDNVKATDVVDIECPTHGRFSQRVNDHIRGHGCNRCARETTSIKNQKGLDHFLMRCQTVHENRYDYTNIPSDVKLKDVVSIGCPEHGMFDQVLDCHLAGSGCPLCARDNHTSRPETEIQQLLEGWGIEFVANDRTIIPPKEIDIFIPSRSIGIEYCGLYWHSETCGKHKNYHADKYQRCAQKGIRLLTIFEDEWATRKNQVINKLRHVLGISSQPKAYARSCEAREISHTAKKQFFDKNHIQGDGPGSVSLGLYHNDILVAAMTFVRQQQGVYYLNRYATSCIVVGGFTKLLAFFKKNTPGWTRIVSFADLRWSVGTLYHANGWNHVDTIPPDYSYVKGTQRFHKFNFRRKHLPRLLEHFDPTKTEKKNCDDNGILRIWDCGKMKFELVNTKITE